jgi:hypothetical protein
MLKIKFSIFIFAFSFLSIFSQEENINNYKYIIVPERFEFQKSEDSFQINSLTKFLFTKYGFEAIISSEKFPEDLMRNRCLSLTAILNDNSKMFFTEMNYDLVDCNNTVVFSSIPAKSKEKVYKKAYHQVIRKTFESFKAMNYHYEPSKSLSTSVDQPTVKAIPNDKKLVSEIKEEKTEIPVVVIENKESILYAQVLPNGFQLVDNTPKVKYTLQETSVKNVFIVSGTDGIVYNSNNKWILEYYIDNQFFKEELKIKF